MKSVLFGIQPLVKKKVEMDMIGGLKQTTSRLAIAAAAGLFTGGLALTPVQAADLGGDCCADLEERVAELEATTVRKGNRKVSVKLSGQVSRAMLFWDDGVDNDVYFIDNNNSSTRIRLTGSAPISAHKTAGFRWEVDLFDVDSGNDVANCESSGLLCDPLPHGDAFGGDGDVDMRWQDVWIKDDRFGKVSLGKGDSASNGAMEVDLSGTQISGIWSGIDFNVSAFRFRNAATGAAMDSTYGAAANNFDGFSRNTRIRYDTPSFGGFVLSTSVGADDQFDGAIRYAKQWNSVRCAAAFHVAHDTETEEYGVEDDPISDLVQYGGSASCIHTPSGLNLTGAWGKQDLDVDTGSVNDPEFWYIKAGLSRRWNSHGKTNIAVDFARNTDTVDPTPAPRDSELDVWGVGLVQNIDAAALELFASYRHAELDDNTGTDFEDLDWVLTGARIKF